MTLYCIGSDEVDHQKEIMDKKAGYGGDVVFRECPICGNRVTDL